MGAAAADAGMAPPARAVSLSAPSSAWRDRISWPDIGTHSPKGDAARPGPGSGGPGHSRAKKKSPALRHPILNLAISESVGLFSNDVLRVSGAAGVGFSLAESVRLKRPHLLSTGPPALLVENPLWCRSALEVRFPLSPDSTKLRFFVEGIPVRAPLHPPKSRVRTNSSILFGFFN
jgi:hypothetical protein